MTSVIAITTMVRNFDQNSRVAFKNIIKKYALKILKYSARLFVFKELYNEILVSLLMQTLRSTIVLLNNFAKFTGNARNGVLVLVRLYRGGPPQVFL